jgi:class 3 adenylate cyclase
MSVGSAQLSCPNCQAEAPAGARFCPSCGDALTGTAGDAVASAAAEVPIDEALQARLNATAPAPLIERMRAARLTGERKPVTALFADVVGSTTLAESMDPEDWTAVLNEGFELMSKAVFRYEGTIAQLQGDAMIAFFGAPVAHEDDPERAILAALDMVDSIDEFARQLKQAQGIDFRIRAGINTGPVMVGNVSTDLRYEYTALGDAVNVAARMQTAAEPGSVLVTATTRRLAGEGFDFDDLGDVALKGKTEPVHAYRVLARRATPGRKRGLERVGLESPMVGRAGPLEKLVGLLQIVRAGRGRVAFLVGEPGIGKSRLLAELRRSALEGQEAAGARPTWVEARCVSYGRNLPYHLLVEFFRGALDIPFASGESEARATLDRELGALLAEEASDVAQYVAHLLELPLSGTVTDLSSMSPEVIQERYVSAAHRVLRALSARGPIVLVCEDVHWADFASVEVMRRLQPLASQLPILFLAALRPDTDSPGWSLLVQARETFGEGLTELRLEPLDERESRELVANLLAIETLPDRVRKLILERAEGNPFFVEEVVRMLIQGGAIQRVNGRWVATAQVESMEIPDTLHGLLLARIDQLPGPAKRSLRVASVIGRQFPVRVLERVLGDDGA